MSFPAIVIGAPKVSTSGAVPVAQPRVEIHDFVQNKKWLSLFIQALVKFMEQDEDNDVSHFGVGGIHGLPFRPWAASGTIDKGNWQGYCTHGTTLFPTWHRPYVAAYEQFIQEAATQVAQEYNDGDWVRAAATLRLPYWDWATRPIPPDEVITMPRITITTATGPQTVANPLWGYAFHPNDDKLVTDSSFTDHWAKWKKTLRWPENKSETAQDRPEILKQHMNRAASQIKSSTYKLFSIENWDDFSNHTVSSNNSSSDSLESIHDNIHSHVGGNGHMSFARYAAHDPIFFLHHSNVDRLLALWQAIHYKVPVANGNSGDGTWTMSPDQTIGANTPLAPFWRTDDSSWNSTATSGGVRDFTNLGYTYPEFEGLDMSNKEAVKMAISNKVKELYGRHRRFSGHQHSLSADVIDTHGLETFHFMHYEREWSVKVTCDLYECDQSFFVLLFLGPPPEKSDQWSSAPSLAASLGFFVNTQPEQCENCKKHRENGDRVEQFAHLSELLLESEGYGGTLDDAVVLPSLKKELNYRIMKVDGTVVEAHDFKSMKVRVLSTQLERHRDGQYHLPIFGDVHDHFGVIANRFPV